MKNPLRVSRPEFRRLAILVLCGLTFSPSLALQAMDPSSSEAGAASAAPTPPQFNASLSEQQDFLDRFLRQGFSKVQRMSHSWLRNLLSIFATLMQDVQSESQRQLDLVTAMGWKSSGAEAQQRLERYKAWAQRIEGELGHLHPPFQVTLLQNEYYLNAVQRLEERKQVIDALPHPTEAEQAERQRIQQLLEKKAVLEERVARSDRYEDGAQISNTRLPVRDRAGKPPLERLQANKIERYWGDKLRELKLHSTEWAQATERVLVESEKILNNFKEFSTLDNQLLTTRHPQELKSSDYPRLNGPRYRLYTRLEHLFERGTLLKNWSEEGRALEELWKEVHDLQALAGRKAQAALGSEEAAVYAKIREQGRRGLYRAPSSERDALEADPAIHEPARRGPLAKALTSNARITRIGEKLGFWANQGEMGALLWLQTLQRLQHSTALLENTLAVVEPAAAARAGQQQAGSLVEILSEGYTAYKEIKSNPSGKTEAQMYEEAKNQLTAIEARYWKTAAKLFYPSDSAQGEQRLEFYFRPVQEVGAQGTQAAAQHAKFQEAWREQQGADQLPYLSYVELEHRWDVLERKPSASYDEIIVQLLAQQPLLQEDHVRIRRGLNQILARPDWLRLRPQVEAILRMEPPTFYLDILKGGLLEELNRKKLTNLADGIEALCRTLRPAEESGAATSASTQPTSSSDLGADLLGAPTARGEEEEGSRQEESRRRGIEETTSRAPESRVTERAPEAARGHGI